MCLFDLLKWRNRNGLVKTASNTKQFESATALSIEFMDRQTKILFGIPGAQRDARV